MAWHTPDRPEQQPIDPRDLAFRRVGGAVLVIFLCILACLWVLAVRWDLVAFFGPPWLWFCANALAPYLGLGLGGLAVLAGVLDRLFGGYFETHLGKGFAAVVLAVLVLWPRYAPGGMLVYTHTENIRAGVRLVHCVYLRLDGSTREMKFTTDHYANVCPRFDWPN